MDTIKKIVEEVKQILYSFSSSVIVNRECLRLLCSLTMFSDQTLLWLKFDSKKVHIDHSNFSDVILKYKDPIIDQDPDIKQLPDDEVGRIIFPPYKKVKPFADKMGVIFYAEYVLVLPKRLNLGKSFTILFRFYNPVQDSDSYHVLLQDPTGLGGLIVIDKSRRRLGAFTIDGHFIDSGIDLTDSELMNKWIQVGMTYKESGDQVKMVYYRDNQKVRDYDQQKIAIPKCIQYIGNSRDYTEPFGIFCDLRIYKNFYDEVTIKNLYYADENGRKGEKGDYDIIYYLYHKAIDAIIKNFLDTHDFSEETFYFTIKVFNHVMINRNYRLKFINYELIMKVLNIFETKKIETKKEVAKFLQTIS